MSENTAQHPTEQEVELARSLNETRRALSNRNEFIVSLVKRVAALETALRQLHPEFVQPPYDHDCECSYCGTKEGLQHPEDCPWEKLKALLAQSGTPQGKAK